jgi:hypothetical protein
MMRRGGLHIFIVGDENVLLSKRIAKYTFCNSGEIVLRGRTFLKNKNKKYGPR